MSSPVNPVVKLFAVLSLGVATAVFPSLWFGVAVAGALVLVAAHCRLLGPFLRLIATVGIPLTIMLVFIQGGYSSSNTVTLVDLGFFSLGQEGTLYALRIVLSVVAFLGGFYLLNRTTRPAVLVAGLSTIGLPAKACYLVLSSLNMVPHMQGRLHTIQQAQAARGLDSGGTLVARIKAFVPLLGPVVMSSLTDAQERGMTLETRGFGIPGVRRTSLLHVPFTARDAFLAASLCTLVACAAIITILWGR